MNPHESDADPALVSFLRENPEWTEVADLIVMPPTLEEIQEEYPEVGDKDLRWNELSGYISYARIGITRGAMYMQARQEGPHKPALCIANQRGSGVKTDDTFFSGMKMVADEIDDDRRFQHHLNAAKKRGFTIPQNSTYYPNIARFPYDPQAYVTRSMGRSYIRKLLTNRGWACEGDITTEHREPERDPLEKAKPLGEDIIVDKAKHMVRKNPDLAHLKRSELRKKVIDKYGPQKVS